jgi:sugar lactone lactonase YvrE
MRRRSCATALASIVLVWGGCADPKKPGKQSQDCTSPGHICTVAGTGERGWGEDGQAATDMHLFLPTDVAFDIDGQPIVVDYNNMRVLRMELDGTLSTVVGMGIHSYATDGIDALDSPIENPISADVGSDGTLYIMEQHGGRVLRVVDGWLDVYAGDADNPGYEGWEGDGGPARDGVMSQSVGLTMAPDGTLYIADTGNHCIRYVTPDGTIDALTGNGEAALADGLPGGASFHQPHHIVWHNGELYVADAFNHAVRRIDPDSGAVTTVAGTGEAGFAGDGAQATEALLNTPQGIALDEQGRLYIADSQNHVVRRVDQEGTIQTWTGQPGSPGYGGDGGPVTDASLDWPTNISIGPDGVIYIVDTLNSVIRTVIPEG